MEITSATFAALDTSLDGTLNADELASTSESLSAWDADASGQISRQEWETELEDRETVSEHQGQIQGGKKGGTGFAAQTNFESGDFARIDLGGDGTITGDEWDKCGLDTNLFKHIAGTSGSISQTDWNDYIEAQDQQAAGAAGNSGKK